MTTSKVIVSVLASLAIIAGARTIALPDDGLGGVKVTFQEAKTETPALAAPIDPTPHLVVTDGGPNFTLMLDNHRLHNGTMAYQARIDNNLVQMFQPTIVAQLPAGKNGKPRLGTMTKWTFQNLLFTREMEVLPSRASKPGEKRKTDTCRFTVWAENKDTREHNLEMRFMLDVMINNNDGALFASPTTHPGVILNGVELKGKTLPDYFQILENANLASPGLVAFVTLRFGKAAEGPYRVLLTNLGVVGNWDAPPQQAGDSALALYWEAKKLKPGEKREMVWGYGGGILSNLENEGKVTVALGGSFEPGKTFTVTSFVEDPLPNQSLTLQLPEGMRLLEGREIQPVPVPLGESGASVVMWKGQVEHLGEFPIRIHSSNGMTQTRTVTIAQQ